MARALDYLNFENLTKEWGARIVNSQYGSNGDYDYAYGTCLNPCYQFQQ